MVLAGTAIIGLAVLVGALLLITSFSPKGINKEETDRQKTKSATNIKESKLQTVVFLDPGHGSNLTPTLATSGGSKGIYSGENTSGGDEDANVWQVALIAKKALEKAGYKVVMSRQGQPDPSPHTLWQKGLMAETADDGKPASIGVSIHTDTQADIGAGAIYYDFVGGYRTNNAGLTAGTATFTNQKTATLSEKDAYKFLAVRERIQKATISISAGTNFSASRGLGSYGTIPIIMLTAQDVPWVYNEMGRTTLSGLSQKEINAYAESIVQGVESCLKATR